jgi:hypothetical protein
VHLADEILQHFLRDEKVGDNAVFQRSNGGDVTGRTSQHPFCIQTNRSHAFLVVLVTNCHHRRLVQNDAILAHVDKGVGGSEIY